MVRCSLARRAASVVLGAILAFCWVGPAAPETLVVPLTGQRVRDIQTAQLFHTRFHDFFLEDDATTYVQSGDIPAMWLRDSSAQTIPYIRFQTFYPVLRARFVGVIERNARNVLTDPYANALQDDYHVWERKWEVDSLAWPVILASIYWRSTHDRSFFSNDLHRALQATVATYACEQQHRNCSHYRYPYRVYTNDAYYAGTGMIWGAFRPSDDAVEYRFNIPQNAIAAVALRNIVQLALDGYGDEALARKAGTLGQQVQLGIERYGRLRQIQSDGRCEHSKPHDAAVHRLVLGLRRDLLGHAQVYAQHGQSVLLLGAVRARVGQPTHAVRFRLAARHHRPRAHRDLVDRSRDRDHDARRDRRRDRPHS